MEFALAADTGYAERLDIVAVAPTSSPTAATVRPVDVLRTPGALDNVFRTLQTLPGVDGGRRVRQPSRGPRRYSRPEPDDDGRRGSSRSVSALRAGERVQPGDDSQVRAGHRWLQREVRRPARQPPRGREPRRTRRARRRHGRPQRDRRQRRGGRRTARPSPRIVARDGAPDVLRPHRRALHRPGLAGFPGCANARTVVAHRPLTRHVVRTTESSGRQA